ncbi:hypothetical protein ACKGJO_00940 [Gracilimonas sp. Q87]|uniref:hypothetical protein n=1 Tax=Gracilimonas sp. Q87 TaxID=3384766 RepID=UPI0039841D1B
MNNFQIDRDVTHHGPRLQKLRALVKLLRLAKTEKGKVHFYFGIESEGDVKVVKGIKNKETTYHEEDKNYDENTSLSLNSPEIKKTLVGFMDTWISKSFSNNCFFNFYSTCSIAKEKKTELIKSAKVKLPKEPFLELLMKGSLSDEALKELQKLFIVFYKNEYKKNKGNGYITVIEKLNKEEWRNFFNQVTFEFGQPDEKELKKESLTLIQDSSFYNSSLSGKEELILSRVLDLLDERHISKDPTENLIHMSELENIFLRVSSMDNPKKDDFVYKLWDQLTQDLNDTRNLRDKITEVSNNVSDSTIKSSVRKATTGHLQKEEYDSMRNFQSLRYRVYEHCLDLIRNFREEKKPDSLTDKNYSDLHTYLKNESHKKIKDLSKDFNYSFESETVIDGIIYQLIDSCFLSYDDFK